MDLKHGVPPLSPPPALTASAIPTSAMFQDLRYAIRQLARGHGFTVVAALGGAISLALAGFLHGVSPFDPAIFLGAPMLRLGVAALACWLSARRPTHVDPMNSLRAA